ncbi:MAG: KpsF/GutQ family sugar-phosphate isomerase [Armatimonadota bacterium]
MSVLEDARCVFDIEIEALRKLRDRLDESFDRAVQVILNCRGKVVVTGMGKSGAVGRKIAGTLSSTGTPSLFLHPGEGVHGDLGVLGPSDVLIALSYSGETDELSAILPTVKRIGVPIVAFCGRPDSSLAQAADVVLDTSVEREACPLGLAPTASTTCMLALGDALAVCVMKLRRFTREDYALFHPAGTLGRKLLLKVDDIMRTGDQLAVVDADTPIRDVLFAITKANAGAACVVDADRRLVGIITDGDIRRLFLRGNHVLDELVGNVMTRDPAVMSLGQLAAEAVRVMEERAVTKGARIGEIPVLDSDGRPVGMLNLKDLVRAGIV